MGWLETDNRAISVQLNLTGTATGTELGKIQLLLLLTWTRLEFDNKSSMVKLGGGKCVTLQFIAKTKLHPNLWPFYFASRKALLQKAFPKGGQGSFLYFFYVYQEERKITLS